MKSKKPGFENLTNLRNKMKVSYFFKKIFYLTKSMFNKKYISFEYF
jgi:hypothetical protein